MHISTCDTASDLRLIFYFLFIFIFLFFFYFILFYFIFIFIFFIFFFFFFFFFFFILFFFFFSLAQIRAQEEIKPLTELCVLLNYVANVAMSSLQLTSTRAMTVGTELFHEKSAIPIYMYACGQCVLFLQSHIIYQVFIYRETGFMYPLFPDCTELEAICFYNVMNELDS